MTRCDDCGRPRFLSPLGSLCPASDPHDPGFHLFGSRDVSPAARRTPVGDTSGRPDELEEAITGRPTYSTREN